MTDRQAPRRAGLYRAAQAGGMGGPMFDFYRRPDRRFPRWLSWLGLATVAASLGFLAAYYGLLGDSTLGPAAGRPLITIAATLEWAVLIGIMAWAFGVAFSWWRTERAHGSA